MGPRPKNNSTNMPGTSNESPIDSLLRRNNNMRANNRESTYVRPSDPTTDRDRSRDQEPHSSSTESENSRQNQSAMSSRHEDREGKEKLLERLRSLGLAPNKYTNNRSKNSSTSKKRMSMTKFREKDGVFFRPRIFECRHCEKLFFHKVVLKVHKKKHYPAFRCAECHECFKSDVAYERHVKRCTSIM